jgi:precorrin-2 dehydrogenase/sirohydrochlorin ferrochelatase
VSGYPVLLRGTSITALVVGGGRVALRKVTSLLAADAWVRVVAPEVSEELRQLSERDPRLTIDRRRFESADVRRATVIIAATDDRATNARVAKVARQQHRLVNVVDSAEEGNFTGMATHRSGDVIIAVSAGGVPGAAARIRDAIAERFDRRYANAIAALGTLRRRILDAGGAREWKYAMNRLVDDRFCRRVESGALAAEVEAWR